MSFRPKKFSSKNDFFGQNMFARDFAMAHGVATKGLNQQVLNIILKIGPIWVKNFGKFWRKNDP